MIDAYPTLASKIWRRLRDLPWRVSEVRDSFLPGEFSQLYRIVCPFTMCSNARLRALYRAVQHVVICNVQGDLVECGTARGGSAALMALTLKQLKAQRTLWVFDTYEGLPSPTEDDPDYDVAIQHIGAYRGELEEVENLFRRLEIPSPVRFVKGLFEFTVPVSPVEKIAVLHIDADWYQSIKVCLDHLYDRVSLGGVIQLDDYGHWAGARKAVDEFLHEHGIARRLRYLDYSGRQFVKEAERIVEIQ